MFKFVPVVSDFQSASLQTDFHSNQASFTVSSYRQGCILIQLVFGSNSKACVVAAGCPGQLDRRLQVAVHLLVNGATKLSAIITETIQKRDETENEH